MDTLLSRPATSGDAKLYFKWANDPEVRQYSHNSEPIIWENHLKWFNNQIASRTIMIVFFLGDEPVGQCRVENKDGVGVISFSIDAKFRGRGLASEILTLTKQKVLTLYLFDTLIGLVKLDNIRSIKAFEKAGFTVRSLKEVNGVMCKEFVAIRENVTR